MTEHLENSHKSKTLSQFSIANYLILNSLQCSIKKTITFICFFWVTPYINIFCLFSKSRTQTSSISFQEEGVVRSKLETRLRQCEYRLFLQAIGGVLRCRLPRGHFAISGIFTRCHIFRDSFHHVVAAEHRSCAHIRHRIPTSQLR